jgi:hypothetical protein
VKRAAATLALALGLGLCAVAIAAPPGKTGTSGDRIASVSTSIAAGVTVLAASPARQLVVEAMRISCDTAGLVEFRDGAAGTLMGSYYLAANTPIEVLQDELLGDACRTSDGTALVASAASGVLTATFRYRTE